MPVLKVKKNGVWETVGGGNASGSNLPEYTEEDYGKVLSATSEGLVWVDANTLLPDVEEATF